MRRDPQPPTDPPEPVDTGEHDEPRGEPDPKCTGCGHWMTDHDAQGFCSDGCACEGFSCDSDAWTEGT